MNPKHLQDAIGNIDDKFIEEAATATKLPPKIWMPAAALAACFLLTTALLPWEMIFSKNDPSVHDPFHTDTAMGILQNNDTSSLDDTKEKDDSLIKDSTENTQLSAEDTTHAETQNPSHSPDTTSPYLNSLQPPDTTGPYPNNTQSPDTTGPYPNHNSTDEPKEENTADFEQETDVPVIPDEPNTPDPGVPIPQHPTILSRSVYPVQEQYPQETSLRLEWRNEKDERINNYQNKIGNTDSFMSLTLCEFFSNSENENLIYSPINGYMTLGMLTETTQGNSRTQLLGLLGENDIYSLRSSANNLWNCCFRDDGIVTTILGNSMWLDNSFVPKTAVTDILAENYYASSFYGNMGDEEYNTLMRSWLDEQTRGVLKDTVSNSSLDPESMMSLMSALYFKADWAEKFDTEVTRNMVFHSPDGEVTAPFMYRDFIGLLYNGANFKSTCLELEEGGEMWFILPREGVSLQSLFSDIEAMGFITGETQKTLSYRDNSAYMWLFLPKFDISSRIDLADGLKNLGITDVFDSDKADFSALTDSNIFIRNITQSARISIDENGCEAASASGGMLPGEGDSIDFGFALNRPFIFVVTSDSGLPLFVGTVNRPTSP